MINLNKTVSLIRKIDKEENIEFIVLYGSYLTKTNTNLSDIDLAIYYDGDKSKRFSFRAKILGELNDKFDVHIFQDMPLYLRSRIIKEGKILYKKNIKNLSKTYIQTIREFNDFERHIKFYQNILREGVKLA